MSTGLACDQLAGSTASSLRSVASLKLASSTHACAAASSAITPAPPPLVPKAPSHGLRSGQGVFHAKFGEGVIVTLEGSGDEARAQVNFGRHGMKWLALWRSMRCSPVRRYTR